MSSGIVGDISMFQPVSRHTIRAIQNPMDKSSVISIYPRPIHDEKPTIEPGVFDIPAGSPDKPGILIVGPSSWWKADYVNPQQPLLEIPTSSIQIAKSIVEDYCNGLIACNMHDSMPGLFFVPGIVKPEDFKTDKKVRISDKVEVSLNLLLQRAVQRQRKWYETLVQLADMFWSNSGGNPVSVSGDMKLAAQQLGLNDKPWLVDSTIINTMIPCVACGAMRKPEFPVCGNCNHIIDVNRAKELGIIKLPA